MAAAAILDFEKNEKFFHRLIPRVKYYIHAKFCLDPMNRIQVIAKNTEEEQYSSSSTLLP